MAEPATEVESDVKRIPLKDWLKEGKKLFGEDAKLWRFVCPNCGHIQTPADFFKLRELGIFKGDPQTAYYSCIGRYDKRIPKKKIGTLGDKKSPCDYTSGGLIELAKTIVIMEGEPHQVFEFDRGI